MIGKRAKGAWRDCNDGIHPAPPTGYTPNGCANAGPDEVGLMLTNPWSGSKYTVYSNEQVKVKVPSKYRFTGMFAYLREGEWPDDFCELTRSKEMSDISSHVYTLGRLWFRVNRMPYNPKTIKLKVVIK